MKKIIGVLLLLALLFSTCITTTSATTVTTDCNCSNRRTIDYHVWEANSVGELMDKVKSSLEYGWHPIGNITAATYGPPYYFQTLVKYEPQ